MALSATSPNLTQPEIDMFQRLTDLAAVMTNEQFGGDAPFPNRSFLPMHQQLYLELQKELAYELIGRGRLPADQILASFAIIPANGALNPLELATDQQITSLTLSLSVAPLLKQAKQDLILQLQQQLAISLISRNMINVSVLLQVST